VDVRGLDPVGLVQGLMVSILEVRVVRAVVDGMDGRQFVY
jgi:hypothetical protein